MEKLTHYWGLVKRSLYFVEVTRESNVPIFCPRVSEMFLGSLFTVTSHDVSLQILPELLSDKLKNKEKMKIDRTVLPRNEYIASVKLLSFTVPK